MENLVRSNNPKIAAIIGTFKTRPPLNFNVALKSHAMAHGIEIEKIEYDGPKFGLKIRAVSIEHVKTFAKHLPTKFPHIVLSAKVIDSKYTSAGAPTKYANPARKSPYLKF
jgi:hypothetical protein